MPKVIIANVDSDSMCGTDMPPEIHALSSMCCDRLLVLAEDDDLVVLPHSVSEEFVEYVNALLGRNLSSRNVVVPAGGDEKLLILNDAALNDGFVADLIRERAGGDLSGWELVAYYLDRPVIALADELGLPLHGVPGSIDDACRDYLRCGGAESYNSKVLFRQLAAGVDAPVPAGRVAATESELAAALRALIGETGRVIVKQDLNSGSAGNTVVTRYDEQVLIGASRVLRVPVDGDVATVAAQLWPLAALQRNTRVVAEAYHVAARVYYSELWVPGPAGAPRVLDFGEMRMEPTFIGFEIPSGRTPAVDTGDMVAHSVALAREAGRRGFVGYMNIDSIVTTTGRLLFNEVNGRMGCCTHIDYLARVLVGPDYARERVLLTYNWVDATDFRAVVKSLAEAGIAFDPRTRTGVVLPIEDVARCGCLDYMVIGRDLEHARSLEAAARTAIAAA